MVRLTRVGVCGSDVHMFVRGHRMDAPLTIGHEGIGRIAGVGEGVPTSRMGSRVVIEPNIPCHHCPECYKGRGNVCRNKRIIGVNEPGCFADYLSLPSAFAHDLPPSVSDEDAVAIEPAAVALSALNRAPAKPGDTIAIIGLGAIGMLLAHTALALGYRVLFSELVQEKIALAESMGAESVSGRGTPEENARLFERAFTEAGVVSLFECAGSADSASLAIASAPRGVDVILLGLSEEDTRFQTRFLSRKGNHIIPSLIYDHPFDFRRCIHLVSRGIIRPGQVVSRSFPLEDLQEALETAKQGKESKIVIRISEEGKEEPS